MPRIQIEDKHTYNSITKAIYGARKNSGSFDNNNTNEKTIVLTIEPTYPVTGTDESNRIGRKIYTSSISTEGFIKLYNTIDNQNINTVYDVYTFHNSDQYTALSGQTSPQTAPFNTNEQALDVSIRHMIVEFDLANCEESPSYFWDWFRNTYIYTGLYSICSNRTQMLRESTAFTGDFNILWDKVHHLSLHNPIVHYRETIPYKRTLNFDGTGSNPPTGKRVFEIFVGPTQIYTDYGSFSLGQWIDNNSDDLAPNIYVGEVNSTLKLKYTDM